MNSLGRVLAAVQGTESDRPAVTLTLSLYGARLTSCPMQEYYTNPRAYLEGQLAVIDQCGPDIVFTPFVLTAEAEAWGCEVAYIANNPPNLKKPILRHAGEIAALHEPDIDSQPRLLYLRETTRLLAAACQGERPVAGILLSPIDLPALLMGVENWLEILLFEPENARLMLEKSVAFFVRWANTLLAEGAAFLAIPSMFTHPRLLTPKIVEETVLPVLIDALQQVDGPIVFHHGGNPIGRFIHLYATLPKVAAFVLDSRDSFSEVRKIIGTDKLLLGNINGPILSRLSPANIRTLCRKVLTDRINDRHFILATSAADVAYDTPLTNIRAMVDAAAEFKPR